MSGFDPTVPSSLPTGAKAGANGASTYDPEAVRAKYLAERDKRLVPGRADIRDLKTDEHFAHYRDDPLHRSPSGTGWWTRSTWSSWGEGSPGSWPGPSSARPVSSAFASSTRPAASGAPGT